MILFLLCVKLYYNEEKNFNKFIWFAIIKLESKDAKSKGMAKDDSPPIFLAPELQKEKNGLSINNFFAASFLKRFPLK